MQRVTIPSTATLKDLYDAAYKTLNLLDYGFSLFSDRPCTKELRSTRSVTLSGSNLNHGEIIYFKQMAGSSVSIKLHIIMQRSELKKCFYFLFSRSRRQVAHPAVARKHRFQLKSKHPQ